MMQNISLVIIDSDRDSRTAIEGVFAPYSDHVKLLGSVAYFQEGLRIFQNHGPMLVILEVKELENGVDQVRQIINRFPLASVFVTTSEKNPDWILRLLRAGAEEYLLKPIQKVEIIEALKKIEKSQKLAMPKETIRGKVVSVYNPVGGMGTTTIATNLAAALAAKREKVAIIDLNLFSGDVATFLDVNPRYTLSSVTTNVNRLDASFLMSVMTRHSSGIYVLSEPLEVEETAGITAEQIQRVIAFLRGIFTYIIIDSGGQLFGSNLSILKSSDHVFFNTVLCLPALKNAKRYLTAMNNQGLGRESVKLIVNRYSPKADIKVRDAEKVLNNKVSMTIPNEYADVIASINKGIPVVNLYPKSPVSMAISNLAGMVN